MTRIEALLNALEAQKYIWEIELEIKGGYTLNKAFQADCGVLFAMLCELEKKIKQIKDGNVRGA